MILHVNEAGVEFGGQLNMNKNHDSSVLCLEPISINDVKHKTRLQEKNTKQCRGLDCHFYTEATSIIKELSKKI